MDKVIFIHYAAAVETLICRLLVMLWNRLTCVVLKQIALPTRTRARMHARTQKNTSALNKEES